MTTKQLIQASLASTRKELEEILPRLSDEILAWAPREGMRTIQGQLVEIAATEKAIVERLRGLPKRSYADIEAHFKEVNTVADFAWKLKEVRQETLTYLEGLNKEQLNATADVSKELAAWLELESVPVGEMLRYIARHESYHCGQLVSYLWARGDDPYQWNS